MEKFSIIIPTLWKSDFLFNMLALYEKCSFVGEIILINNDPSVVDISAYSKLIVITPGRNIYVNPAWNLGASIARYTIVLANDDIFINDLDKLFSDISKNDYDLIGATVNNLTPIRFGVSKYILPKFPRKSFGCFMVCRNYMFIPRQLLIYSGDRFLFENSVKVGLLGSGYIFTPISATMKSDDEFYRIGKEDVERYRQLVKK